jgi:2,4-dienoyl-CoA reductase-like NADH-dependent reductase (Old Yellow Enzyme family)
MNLTHVHTPLQIGGVTLKNRVARTAHATNIGGGAGMTDDLIAYHETRARGGCGLLIVEIMGVHPTSPSGLNAVDSNTAKATPGWSRRSGRPAPRYSSNSGTPAITLIR